MTSSTRKFVSLAAVILWSAALGACDQSSAEQKPEPLNSQEQTRFNLTHVDVGEVLSLLEKNKQVHVLDIRTAMEISKGYIEGALFADFHSADFENKLSKLDKQTPYLVHCASGGRSTKALKTLKKMGFENIIHMDGGMRAWRKANLPIVKP